MSVESEFRQVLGEMEVWLQYGTTVNLAPTRGGSDGYGRPPGEEWPAHLKWRARWDGALERERETVLVEAREALADALKQKRVVVVPETQVELEARVVREGSGWSVAETARHCRCTETFVRKTRVVAGVDMASGKPAAEPVKVPRSERAERAIVMRGEGKTMRQIAMLLGCDPMTVHRDLAGRAAAC